MVFNDVLNGYIKRLGCSAKELSDASHVSPAVISRYRSGERIPNAAGPQLVALAEGIEELSRQNEEKALAKDEVLRSFVESITGIVIGYEAFLKNLNTLVSTLGISNNELARALSFDPSYISRILAGRRHPADMPQFVSVVSQYVARRYADETHAATMAALMGCNPKSMENEALCARAITNWLGSNIDPRKDSVTEFLRKLDTFDLGEFIRAIRLENPPALATPLQLPITRTYTGIAQMMESEIDFLRAAALSKSDEDVIMYSDMPLEDTADDPAFPKRWMYGMALLLKRNLRLHIIHDVNRPFREMMVGLESWIPLYMTGQVASYYLQASQGRVFCHLLRTSGTAALSGEAIAGHQAEGRYTLTRDRDEVEYYRRRSRALLKCAHPLVEAFTAENAQDFDALTDDLAHKPLNRRFLLASPPIATISQGLLGRMLSHNDVTEAEAARIGAFGDAQRKALMTMLERGRLVLEVPMAPEEGAKNHPLPMSLSGMFHENGLSYTHGEYREHLEQTESFADDHPSCTVKLNPRSPFRNVEIAIHEGECVVVSKGKAPAVHFVIRHPNMVTAFENFVPPLADWR